MFQNKYGLVDISGGFGNQLFQYSMANFLQQKGINVSINTFWYSSDKKFPRDQIFYPNFYGFSKANKVVLKFYDALDKNINQNNYFKNKNENIVINELKKFNRFVGYWQDLTYLKQSKDFLISKLSQNQEIKNGFNFKPEDNSVLIHIRRGDYLTAGKVIDISYYEESIKKIKEKIHNPKFNIFTEDEDWVKSNAVFNEAENIFSSSSSVEDTISTFSQMLRHQNYIISNSTFSYLSAYLKFNKDSTVVIPETWMPNSNKYYNLYPKNWIKIKSN